MGLRRSLVAETTESINVLPSALACLANSTIRIAFLADKPMMVTNPTLKKTSLAIPLSITNATAPIIPSGITKITANGIDQLSYKADKTRKITSIEKSNKDEI